MDVAVFRFTLGIPGFEDRLIPRIVGFAGGALLAVNHLFAYGDSPAPDAQVCLAWLHASCTTYARQCIMFIFMHMQDEY